MNHRGIDYTIVQGIGGRLWKWTITINGKTLRGQEATKSEAVADAERAIDRALASKKFTVNAGPNALIPFVAASAFELRQMSSHPSEGWHSVVLPTAKVLPQRPIPADVAIDDLEGVLAARVPHAGDQEPLAEERAAREASAET